MPQSLEDLLGNFEGERRERPLRPDPAPRSAHFPLISVDDHLLEPPDLFEGRLPRGLRARAPLVQANPDGYGDYWQFEDVRVPVRGGNGAQSWLPEDWYEGAVSYSELRPGITDVHARVRDMDVAGTSASLCFPSMVFGFCGQRFMRMADAELGLACMRAYNNWILEGWVGPYPERFIPSQVPWLLDPEVAAAEIRRNAQLGFRAVTFSEMPQKLGLPSIHSRYWDPFFSACEDTETVINLHVGSSSQTFQPSDDSPPEVLDNLFPINSLAATVDWLFALVPVRFPGIKIVLSEGGIGWVPMLIDRLKFCAPHFEATGLGNVWSGISETPAEVLRRNFWFATLDDPAALQQRGIIGVDRIMFEVDYPHADSTWPDSQERLWQQVSSFPAEEVRMMAYENAAKLYRFSSSVLA